jgi:hypothetical protein
MLQWSLEQTMTMFAHRFPTANILFVLATRMAENVHAEYGMYRTCSVPPPPPLLQQQQPNTTNLLLVGFDLLTID